MARASSESPYHVLFDNNPDGILITDVETKRFTYANPAICRMLGYPVEVLTTLGVTDIHPPDRLSAVVAMFDSMTRRENHLAADIPCLRKDGSVFHADITGTVSVLAGRNCCVGFFRDVSQRKEIEGALRQSWEQHSAILQTTMDGFWRADRHGRLREVNQTYCRMSGYSEQELLAMRISDLEDRETAGDIAAHMQRIKARGEDRFESRHRHKDGTLFDLEVSVQYRAIEGGQFVVFLRDITERKRAEAAMRETQESLHESQRIAGLGTYALSIASGVWTSSSILDQIFGIDATYHRTVEGWAALIHPDDRGAMTDYLHDEILGRGRDFDRQYRIIRRNDQMERWVHGRGQLTRDAQGRPATLHGTIQDITERKGVEVALRQSEERLNFALDAMQAGAWQLDLVDHTAHRSLMHDRIFGYAALLPRWTYEMFLEHVVPEDRELVDRKFRQTVAARHDWNFECRIIRQDQAIRWVWACGRCHGDAGGKPRQLIGIVQDITERKQAEAALRREQVMLARTESFAHIGSWEWDVATDKVTWSSEMFRLFQRDPQAGAPNFAEHSALYSPEEMVRLRQAVETAVSQGTPYELELRALRKDGATLVCVARGFAEIAPGQRATRLFGFLQDITERKRAEEALQASERKLRSLFDTMSEGVALNQIIYDEQGEMVDYRILDVNKAFYEMADYEPGPVIGNVATKLYGMSCGLIKEFWKSHRNATGAVHSEMVSPKSKRVFFISTSPFVNDLFVTSFMDITERKRAEKALRESELQYRTLANSGQALIWTAGLDKKCDYFNQPWLAFTGRTLQQELGGGWAEGVHPDDLARCFAIYTAAFDRRERFSMDYRIRHHSGAYRWIQDDGTPRYDSQGNFLGYIGHCLDITERKLLEEQLHQARKLESIGRLAGGLAHDFNNKLTVILANTEIALQQTSLDQPLHAFLDEIRKAASHSADLTRQLLAFARKQTIRPEVLDLNAAVSGMLKMLRRLIGEHIQVVWRPQEGLWPVKIDPAQLDQILANLCVNARDAIAQAGIITIETGPASIDAEHSARLDVEPGDYVRLVVRDDGCGMNEETRAHIFEPFFTTKEVGQGTGLGLATVYGIVEQNRGFIEVASAPGAGSTFTIHLPRHQGAPEPAAAPAPRQASVPGGQTILLVEDDASVRNVIRLVLETHGYTVVAAGSPSEALRLAAAHPGVIHLLLSDVVMPEMNGRELSRKLLILRPGLACLFTSGHSADYLGEQGVLEQGMNFLPKPSSPREMLAKVQEVMDGGRGRGG